MTNLTFTKRYILVIAFFSVISLCIPSLVLAQKREILAEEEEVQEAVTKEVGELFKSEDFLKKKSKKFKNVAGYIVVDIAVVQNGKIASFFKVDTDIKDIDFIEFLSKTVFDHKFAFKLPKQQRYKIRQTINIE